MIEQNTFTIIFGVFLLLTCRDMFFGQSTSDTSPDQLTKPSMGPIDTHEVISDSSPPGFQGVALPQVKIQYCHSCGYKQAFDEISKLLVANYQGIKVIGEYHQPGWIKAQIVNLLFITKIALLAMIYMDINPFNYLQMQTPRLWTTITQSKVPASLIILFMTNSIESNMMSTGAFEIYLNDMPVWSKISTGRMPSAPELLQIVGSHYKLAQTPMYTRT